MWVGFGKMGHPFIRSWTKRGKHFRNIVGTFINYKDGQLITVNMMDSISFMTQKDKFFSKREKISSKEFEQIGTVLGTEEDKQAPGLTKEDCPSGNQQFY